MCPRIWPIEDICIGLYVLNRLLAVSQCLAHLGKKLCQCNTVSKSFQKKQRRVELKSVGNFVAKAVLVESANQFSLEDLCRTQYSMKMFFRSHIDHQTYGKTLSRITTYTQTQTASFRPRGWGWGGIPSTLLGDATLRAFCQKDCTFPDVTSLP